MRHTLAALALLLPLVACQKQDETPAPPPASAVEVPGAHADAPDFSGDFNALGNEPFWAVQIRSDGISLQRPEGAPEVAPLHSPVIDGASATFTTITAGGKALVVTLTAQPCIDGMSGFTYAYMATVKSGDESMTGCATRPETAPESEAD